jgi:hypothetical protein
MFGTITWTPSSIGNMREVFLLKMNDKYRLQISVQGCANPSKKKVRAISKSNLVLSSKPSRPVLGDIKSSVLNVAVAKLASDTTEKRKKMEKVEEKKKKEKVSVGKEEGNTTIANPLISASTKFSKKESSSSFSSSYSSSSSKSSKSSKVLSSGGESTKNTSSHEESASDSQVKGFEAWINYTLYPPQDLCDADIELSDHTADTHGLRLEKKNI